MTVSTSTPRVSATSRVRGLASRRRLTVLRLLLLPTARQVPWWYLGAGVATAVLAVANARRGEATLDRVVTGLRLAMLALASSAAFAVDDPSEDTLSATPVSVLTRRLLRMAASVAVLSVAWVALLAWAEVTPTILPVDRGAGVPTAGTALPVLALSIELTAALTIVLAAAALGVRSAPDRSGGVVGIGILLLAFGISAALPARFGLLIRPEASVELWHTAHVRWAVLAAFCLTVLLHTCSDPGRQRLRQRWRRVRPR